MRLVQGHGVNDMYWGWVSENEWNKKVYWKWANMLYRCYNEDFHKTKSGEHYKDCTVCDRWLILSNFVEDFVKIDGYDEERFLNGELTLDKDIKSGKRGEKNKQYIMIECLLTTQDENTKEANRTRDYSDMKMLMQGENNPMYGKHHTEKTKQKMSEANLSENNPNSKRVAQYDKQTLELIKIWNSMHDVERELGINNGSISECCRGKRKSAGGFIWKYVEVEEC